MKRFLFLMGFPALLVANATGSSPLLAPRHGGKLVDAPAAGKSSETFYIELVKRGNGVKIYPYVLESPQSSSWLVVTPSRELKKVIVRLGSEAINTQKQLPAKLTKSAIETRLDGRAVKEGFDTLIVTIAYKNDFREARIHLDRLAE
jgi:hypothetical protein